MSKDESVSIAVPTDRSVGHGEVKTGGVVGVGITTGETILFGSSKGTIEGLLEGVIEARRGSSARETFVELVGGIVRREE